MQPTNSRNFCSKSIVSTEHGDPVEISVVGRTTYGFHRCRSIRGFTMTALLIWMLFKFFIMTWFPVDQFICVNHEASW